MQMHNYVAKTKEEAIQLAKDELNVKEEELYIKEQEVKGGLFKSKKMELQIITKQELIDFIKDTLQKILTAMGLDVKIEVKTTEKNVAFTMYSNNNAILIGKAGRNLEALTTMVRQIILNQTAIYFPFTLDAGEYKKHHQKDLERLAKQTAREVVASQMEIKLTSMNSYERRIIHHTLMDHPKVRTESIGEEPNRCVIIKPNNEK